jgi:hypothetical protein
MTPYPWTVHIAPGVYFRSHRAPGRVHRWVQRVVFGFRWEYMP